MGALDIAFSALKDIPATGALRSQVDLLHIMAAQLERQLEVVTAENIKLQLKLQNIEAAYKDCQQSYQELEARHAEEQLIKEGMLFLKGKRTSGVWQAFCPKCRMPLVTYPDSDSPQCSDANCTWSTHFHSGNLRALIHGLG